MKSASHKPRVLLVEDDIDVAASLADYLEARDLPVDFAYSLGDARRVLASSSPDVIVLDVQLPDGNGIAFCRDLHLRDALPAPVIFLTARGRLEDRLAGFDAGAVDYIVKPFEPAELLARIFAVGRRPGLGRFKDIVEAGSFLLECNTGLLRRDDAHLRLQKSGLIIAQTLMEAAPGTVGRDRLSDRIWNGDVPESDPLRAHVHALRVQLRDAFGLEPVKAVRNLGYRWDESQ